MTPSTPQFGGVVKRNAESLAGRRALVVGLGRFGGGVGVTRWLAEHHAAVTVTDQATHDALAESVAAVADLPVTLHLGGHDERDLDTADLVVINPAVHKATSAFFQTIARRGIPWTTEMNLFCERCPSGVIGVTGSYGKSTTCAMLAEVLEAARRAGDVTYTGVHLGGNIGRSLLNDLPDMRESDWVVLEMSNAQLEDLPRIDWAPDVAVITNLFPHHLDRYSSFADYAQAKLNITRHPEGTSKIVVGELHPDAEELLFTAVAGRRERLVHIPSVDSPIEMRGSNRTPSASAGPSAESRRTPNRSLALPVLLEALRVPGRHNQRNAACVLTVCRLLGLNEAVVRAALRDFKGLPHRLEFIRTLDGVDYYNDSKSTAPAATVIALEALQRPTVAIVGGQRKDVPLADCAKILARWCRVVICMGESGPAFAEAVNTARRAVSCGPPHSCGGFFDDMIVHVVEALPDAVRLAHAEAKPGEVVLFSPGAPSFDQYANFTARGRHFVGLVNALRPLP
ncbi:MAG: UDP-N-acetylmuramoyl-L-alanine--D-glutamate ligase [Planctomycetota bacterium]